MRSVRGLVSAFILHVFLRSTEAITCYSFAGNPYENNKICPGSNACCGETATCLGNRLCHNEGDNAGTFVRGPCAELPYDPVSCAQICLYDETTGIFPRVTVCGDGSYCCNDDPQCCQDNNGVFLNAVGEIVSSPPSSSLTSTSSSSSSSSSLSSLTSTSSSTSSSMQATSPTQSPSSSTQSVNTNADLSSSSDGSSGLATGAKIGMGVGIPLGVLALGALAAFIWFRRRQIYSGNTRYSRQPQELPGSTIHAMPGELQGYPKSQSNIPIELPASEEHQKWVYKPYGRNL